METIHLDSMITLGKFLKYKNIIGTGGEAKWFLSEHEVFLNGEPENRRGKNCTMVTNWSLQVSANINLSIRCNDTKRN